MPLSISTCSCSSDRSPRANAVVKRRADSGGEDRGDTKGTAAGERGDGGCDEEETAGRSPAGGGLAAGSAVPRPRAARAVIDCPHSSQCETEGELRKVHNEQPMEAADDDNDDVDFMLPSKPATVAR
jgi:hypothetical protein